MFQHSQRTRNGNISGSRSHENADLIIDLIQFFIEGDVSSVQEIKNLDFCKLFRLPF